MHPLAPAALLLTLAAPPADTAAVVAVTDAVAPAPVAPAPVAAAPAAAAEPVWQTNLNSAFKLSGETGKPMLVLFGAEWCGYCHKQDAETLSDPAVRRALAAGFVPVRLDIDANRRAAEILEIETLPQAVILAPNADLLGRAKGFHTVVEFDAALTAASARLERNRANAARAARVAAAPEDTTTL